MDDIEVNSNEMTLPERGFFRRFIGILFSPGEVFIELERKPRWIFPLLLAAFGQWIFFVIRFPLYKQLIVESTNLTNKAQGLSMTPEQLEAATSTTLKMGLAAIPIGGVIGILISTLIFFTLMKMFKGSGTYVQYLSVIGYAGIISFLYYALAAGLSFFTGDMYLKLACDSISAYLNPDLEGTFLFGFGRGIRFFSIWEYIVIGIGLAQLSKLSRKKVFIIVGILFITFALISGGAELITARLQSLY